MCWKVQIIINKKAADRINSICSFFITAGYFCYSGCSSGCCSGGYSDCSAGYYSGDCSDYSADSDCCCSCYSFDNPPQRFLFASILSTEKVNIIQNQFKITFHFSISLSSENDAFAGLVDGNLRASILNSG